MVEHFKVDQGIIRLQQKIGLPENFFKDLMKEDDWSFIIKLHALIEGVCNSLLLFHFNEPKLEKIFSRLDISDSATGKLAFLTETNLLGSEDRKFITALSQFRNKFVHNVKYYNIDLKQFIKDLDPNQKKSFAIAFSPFESILREINKIDKLKVNHDQSIEKQIDVPNIIKRFENNPKFHIWLGANHLLVSIYDMHAYSDYLQSERAEKILNDDREFL